MTTTERVAEALLLAKQASHEADRSKRAILFHEASNILHITNADDKAWAKFGKFWRGE